MSALPMQSSTGHENKPPHLRCSSLEQSHKGWPSSSSESSEDSVVIAGHIDSVAAGDSGE